MNSQKTILYIDDEFINQQVFSLTFEDDFDIVCASSGKEGLEIIESNKNISIVICDMKMPYMTGLEFIKKAKKKSPMLTYYILTGFEDDEDINQAVKDGLIEKYFRKPFEPDDILSSLQRNLSESK